MCLLQTATSLTLRTVLLTTPGLIEDIYAANSDGLGIMYADETGLQVRKTLPKNAAAARAFIEQMPADDRQVALHWRWRTHGDVNLAMCHPYMVSEQIGMMHNGILHTGNDADESKSDTWHFIEDYLKTLSADVLHDPKLGAMIGEFIDQNRFAIMSGDGRLTVINQDQGVEYGGVWYSNTYAWSPELVDPAYKKRFSRLAAHSYATKRSTLWDDTEDDIEDGWDTPAERFDESCAELSLRSCDALDQAIDDCDAETLADFLADSPQATLEYLFQNYQFFVYERTKDSELDVVRVNMRREVVDGEELTLLGRLEADMSGAAAEMMAETIQWYCEAYVRGRDGEAELPLEAGQVAALLS